MKTPSDPRPKHADPVDPASFVRRDQPPDRRDTRGGHLACQRCGFPVRDRAWGCKNPCSNCGTIYPLGDCSD